MTKEEKLSRLLLVLEIVIITTNIIGFVLLIISAAVVFDILLKAFLIFGAILMIITAIVVAFIIEREAGYYECELCKHKYEPNYKELIFSSNIMRKRYLKCPKCNETSWSKKVYK